MTTRRTTLRTLAGLGALGALGAFATTPAAANTPNSTPPATGSGTAGDPYVITTVQELQWMENELSAHYLLDNDIDASDTVNWNGGEGFIPIGDSSTSFTGSFDGQGNTISGLTINRPTEDSVGLFGFALEASIRNVTLTGLTVTGRDGVGGLVGANQKGTVSDCSSSGQVTGDDFVGGLVGGNRGPVSESYASGTVTGNDNVGGLIGIHSELVSESYASGTVTGNDNVGGLAGWSIDGGVLRSYASGPVSGNSSVGGLIGWIAFGGVQRSYASGPVSGNSSVGGLVGENIGGNVGESYWDTEMTGQTTSADGGTGLTTAQMTGAAAATNMTGFAFGPTWVLTDSYPRLLWSLEALALTLAEDTILVDEDTQATVSLSFVDTTTETGTTVSTYVSSDTAVATIADDGVVSGNAQGEATLTASLGGLSDTATITVEEEDVFPDPIVLPDGTEVTPEDTDGDGLYEDLDGDGDVDGQDVSRLTRLENAYRRGKIELTDAQVAALDFNGDGQFTKADIDAYTAMYDL
ncbi:hypothetical protein DU504_04015 [Haloplanus salinus]|uniref:GLUG domain-containing protein n=1 Tax=Haloplanus salinus TaxID=1126245 RepID=A0A368NAE8_9EURY|nr:hypothetical protein DU504_04015 [Haloplanus salinus]